MHVAGQAPFPWRPLCCSCSLKVLQSLGLTWKLLVFKGNVPPADCKPRVGRYIDCSLPASPLYRGNGIRIIELSMLKETSRAEGLACALLCMNSGHNGCHDVLDARSSTSFGSQTYGDSCLKTRQGRDSQTTTLTCSIAGTPDCSHLSSWGLLPDHCPKVVLVTNLMGLCKGSDGEVDRVEGQ